MTRPPLSSVPSQADAFSEGRVFDRVFTEGMALVEETAAYLDGRGRDLAECLPREAGKTYTHWSMELTTRLMQAASWLVMQKAVRDGDMLKADAMNDKYRIERDEPPLNAAAQRGRGMPDEFLNLVERAENLFERICRLDAVIYLNRPPANSSPVGQQIAQLQRAADRGAFDPLRVWSQNY